MASAVNNGLPWGGTKDFKDFDTGRKESCGLLSFREEDLIEKVFVGI
jgi:hypothetical protein